MKKTWKQENSIKRKCKYKVIITFTKTGKGFESDSHCIANCFNYYFTSVVKKLSPKKRNQI